MTERDTGIAQDIAPVTILSREDLVMLPSSSPEAIRTSEDALQEFLRELATYPNVVGVGAFQYEQGSRMTIFTEKDLLDPEVRGQGAQLNEAISAFTANLRRVDKKGSWFDFSYRGLHGRTFDEAVEYFSKDHPESQVDRELLEQVESGGELPEGMSQPKAFWLQLQAAMDLGNLQEQPAFVKFE